MFVLTAKTVLGDECDVCCTVHYSIGQQRHRIMRDRRRHDTSWNLNVVTTGRPETSRMCHTRRAIVQLHSQTRNLERVEASFDRSYLAVMQHLVHCHRLCRIVAKFHHADGVANE